MRKAVNYVELISEADVIKQGDTVNSFLVKLFHQDGTAVDVSSASVTWNLATKKGRVIADKPVVREQETGVVRLTISPEDSTGYGRMEAEIVVEEGGETEVFPANGDLDVTIKRNTQNLEETPVAYATISYFQESVTTSLENSDVALTKAYEANDKADSTQTQLDQVVIDGDSSVEAAQARVRDTNEGTTTFDTLKKRNDDTDEQLLNTTNALGVIASIYSTLQDAADDAKAKGGGYVVLTKGTTFISQEFIMRPGVIFKGQGKLITTLKVASDFTGDCAFKSENFDSLVGTNSWLESEGVPSHFGFVDLNIEGDLDPNNLNNLPVSRVGGVWIYGKNYIFDNVLIHNFSGEAFHSECGAKGGQEGPSDMPEYNINNLEIRDSSPNDNQFYFAGPHDAVIGSLYLKHGAFGDKTGSVGLYFDKTANTNGFCHIDGTIHAYGHEIGMIEKADIHANNVVLESMQKKAVEFHESGTTISKLELYKNGRIEYPNEYILDIKDGTDRIQLPCVEFKGNHITTSSDNQNVNKTFMYIGGTGHKIGFATTENRDNNSTGVIFNCSASEVSGLVKDFQTGVVFKAGMSHNDIELTFRGISQKFVRHEFNGTEEGNDISLKGYSGSSIDGFFNDSIGSIDAEKNNYYVFLKSPNGVWKFPETTTHSDAIDLTITSLQKIALPHRLPFIPNKNKVMAIPTIKDDLNRIGHHYEFIRVRSIDATNAVVDVKLSVTNSSFNSEDLVVSIK